MNVKKVIAYMLVLINFSTCILPAYCDAVRKEVDRVRPYIEELRQSGRPIFLVMGDITLDLREQYNESYLFLVKEQVFPDSNRSMSLDFNNPHDLGLLSLRLSNTFDRIILEEGNRFCFTEWTESHLKHIKNMLKPGGEFIFLPGMAHIGGKRKCPAMEMCESCPESMDLGGSYDTSYAVNVIGEVFGAENVRTTTEFSASLAYCQYAEIAVAAVKSEIPTHYEVPDPIQEQVDRVLPYIENLRQACQPVYLVIGVSNGEKDLEKRFNESYLFLDIKHSRRDGRSISLDFNDLRELDLLSRELENTFDMIVLDHNVFCYTKWTESHLKHIKNMLKPGGEFIFMPWQGVRRVLDSQYKPLDYVLCEVVDQIILAGENDGMLVLPKVKIPKCYLYTQYPDVQEKVKNLPPFMDLTDYTISKGCVSYSNVVNVVMDMIFYEEYIPYYVGVLKEVFGVDNVRAEAGRTLPFKVHADTRRCKMLVTATKAAFSPEFNLTW